MVTKFRLLGIGWFINAAACLLIGFAVARILFSGRTATLELWEIMPGIPAGLTVDPLSAFFILILCIAGIPASIYASSYYTPKSGLRVHTLLFFLFLLSMTGVFAADNAWIFLILWETMSLVSFGLVVYEHGQPHVRRAGFIYLAMTHLSAMFLMIAFALMSGWSGSIHFSDWAAAAAELSAGRKNLIFTLVLIGFGTKAGMVPFHVWLPRAHPAAPAPVSSMMSSVMVKAGIYGLLRVVWDWFSGGTLEWGVILLALGLVSALVGGLYLIVNDDLKQLLAFSTVENMGILLMAMGAACISLAVPNPALAALSFAALLLHALNHAVFKSLLFLVSGSVQHGAGTALLNRLGGLGKLMPYTAACFFIGAAAMSALPMLNGFIGEWLLFQSLLGGMLHWPILWKGLGAAAFAGLGMVGALAAAGMVKAVGSALLAKPRSEQASHAHESPPAMRFSMLLLTAGAVAGGLFPAAVWSWVKHAAGSLEAISVPQALPMLQDGLLQRAADHGAGSPPVLAMPLIALLVATVLIVLLIAIPLLFGISRVTRGEVWGCGHSLTERMEYTATSLSYPIVMFFRGFYRPELFKSADEARHTRTIRLEATVEHLIEAYLYRPAFELSIRISRKFREIQNGHIQQYLAYILITILILLLVHIF